MIPRKRFDISWKGLGIGLWGCIGAEKQPTSAASLESLWSPHALACLSVRTGFDLLWGVLQLPAGSEILISAVTIPDMVRILERHHLIPIPLDIDPATLMVNPEQVKASINERTKAILITPIFGTRFPIDEIAEIAQNHALLLLEDHAQAYVGDRYRGHPRTDVMMVSFGSIKTATAFGGGLFSFRSESLRKRMIERQMRYPIQPTRPYLFKLLKYAGLKVGSTEWVYTVLCKILAIRGINHDRLMMKLVKGFPPDKLFQKIRYRPSSALLQLMHYQISRPHNTQQEIAKRTAIGEKLTSLLPSVIRPATDCPEHTHWIYPILAQDPDQLVSRLQQAGFDATRGNSSLAIVPYNPIPTHAKWMMEHIIYLPVYSTLSPSALSKMAQLINQNYQQPPPYKKSPTCNSK